MSDIVQATGLQPQDFDALHEDLESAIMRFDIRQAAQQFPKRRGGELATIETTCRRLVKLLGGDADEGMNARPHLPHHLNMALKMEAGPEANPQDTLERLAADASVVALWCRDARHYIENPPAGDPIVDIDDVPDAVTWLMGTKLPSVFERRFRTPFVIRKPYGKSGAPTGPGISFVMAILKEMEIDRTAYAVARAFERAMPQASKKT